MSLFRGAPGAQGAPGAPTPEGNDNATRRVDAARTPSSSALAGDTAGPLAVADVVVALGLGLQGLQLGGGGLQEGGGLGMVVLERRGVRRPAVQVQVAQPGRVGWFFDER